jgi:hypothetical protein
LISSRNASVTKGQLAGLRRFVARLRARLGGRSPEVAVEADPPSVVLRPARADEAPVVRRLAALDDAPVPRGPLLLALVDNEAVAALSLLDGNVVSNPFVSTREAVALLRLRADHLLGAAADRRRRATRTASAATLGGGARQPAAGAG